MPVKKFQKSLNFAAIVGVPTGLKMKICDKKLYIKIIKEYKIYEIMEDYFRNFHSRCFNPSPTQPASPPYTQNAKTFYLSKISDYLPNVLFLLIMMNNIFNRISKNIFTLKNVIKMCIILIFFDLSIDSPINLVNNDFFSLYIVCVL